MRVLHSLLNMPEYALTEFWISFWFWICQDSEFDRVLNMQKLHRVLNMPRYDWICLNRTWICLNMSEVMLKDRLLNMYHIIHSARLLYKLMITYWKIGLFTTQVVELGHFNKHFVKNTRKDEALQAPREALWIFFS